MSIKELFVAIANTLKKLLTAKYGVGIVLGLIICFFIGKTIIDYQEFTNQCEISKEVMQYQIEKIENMMAKETNQTCISDCMLEKWKLNQLYINLVPDYENDSFLFTSCELEDELFQAYFELSK